MKGHVVLPEIFEQVNALREIEASTRTVGEKIRAYKAIMSVLSDNQIYQIAAFLMNEHNNDDVKQTPKNKKDHNFIRVRTLTRLLYTEMANRVAYNPSDLASDVPDVMNKLNWYVLRNAPRSENVDEISNAIGNIYFTRDPEETNWLEKLSDAELEKRFKDNIEYAQNNLGFFKVNIQEQLIPDTTDRERMVKLIFEIEKVKAQKENELSGKIINARVKQDENPNQDTIDEIKKFAISANIEFLKKLNQTIEKTTGEKEKLSGSIKDIAGSKSDVKKSSGRMASNPILVKKNSFFKLKKAQSAAKLPVKDDSKQMIRQLDAKSEELSKNIKNCKESFISTLKSIVTDIEHHSMTDMNELHQQINDSIDQVSALSQQLNDGDSVINELKKLEERLQEAKIKLNQDRGATVSMQGLHGRRSSENAQTRLSVDESAQKSPGKKL